MRIFGSVEVPDNKTKINQVWQVGGAVTGGVPDKHEFRSENLKATGELDLLKGKKVVQEQKSNGTVSGTPPVTVSAGGGNQKGNGTKSDKGGNATSTAASSSSSILGSSRVSFWSLFVGIVTIFWSV